MNLTEQLSQQWNGMFDKLKDQEWYQQLQSRYEQLPSEQQNYVKWGSLGLGLFLFLFFSLSALQSANSLKDEYFEKQELLQLVNQSSDEIRRLKGQNSGLTQGAPQPWKSTIQSVASGQGITPDSIEILKENPGASQNVIQETLLEVQIKGVALRPLIQVLYQMEHGTPPMKIKGLLVETNASDGTVNAKLNLSGFTTKAEKAEKK